MSDTIEVKKASKSLFWKTAYVALTLLVGYYIAWSFTTIVSMSRRDARREMQLEAQKDENQAQWLLLRETTERLRVAENELEVTKRIFNMLLSQGKLELSFDVPKGTMKSEPKKQDSMAAPARSEPFDAFRHRQMVEWDLRKPR